MNKKNKKYSINDNNYIILLFINFFQKFELKKKNIIKKIKNIIISLILISLILCEDTYTTKTES